MREGLFRKRRGYAAATWGRPAAEGSRPPAAGRRIRVFLRVLFGIVLGGLPAAWGPRPASAASFDFADQIKISGGAPGAGKLLTSDAAGLASWQSSGSQACPADMAAVGSWCVDKYEASVWNSASCTGTQYGVNGVGNDDYPAACNDNGSGCKGLIFACSLGPNTTKPSTWLTWFQANIACANAGKELLPNAVWQMAASGTPDPGTTNSICNVASLGTPANTGQLSTCVSDFGVLDMAGNVWEWVADWGQYGPDNGVANGGYTNTAWSAGAGYGNDGTWNVAGAAYTNEGGRNAYITGLPGALIRGGYWGSGGNAGVFALSASFGPSYWNSLIGFRCGRRR